MRKVFINEIQYKKGITLVLSFVFLCMGLISFITNCVNIENMYDYYHLYFTISSVPIIICFIVYYILTITRKIILNYLISISFSSYSIAFYVISDISYILSYILLFFSIILIFCSFNELDKSFIGISVIIIIASTIFLWKKYLLFPEVIQFNKTDTGVYAFLAYMFIMVGTISTVYILLKEIIRRKQVKLYFLHNKLSPKEIDFCIMKLLDFSNKGICKRLNIDTSTYRGYNHKIKQKLQIYTDLTRNSIIKSIPRKEKKKKPDRSPA